MVLTFVQKENCYGGFTSSKMDRLVYWSVFPGLRRRLRVPARCKAVCDGILILRTVTCGCQSRGRKGGRELAGRRPLRNRRAALHTNRASVSWALNDRSSIVWAVTSCPQKQTRVSARHAIESSLRAARKAGYGELDAKSK
jgi:hypothetical protein